MNADSKIAYFDCFSGISGDMIIGALLDAGAEFHRLKAELAKLPLSDYELHTQKISKQHITATKFDVVDKGQTAYRHLKDLNAIVEDSNLPEEIQKRAKNIFLRIAQAEARIHGQPIEKIHFHEIGAVDTIVDVVGALICLKLLKIDKVFCSKINVGSGFVEFSHGKFPVPAPATAELLKGVPIYSSDIQMELTTPTGAAIITEIASGFGELPVMVPETIGYGAGERDLSQPNVLRVFVGHQEISSDLDQDRIVIMETNIDDMNPQWYDTVMEKLLQQGALDVYLTSVLMKKGRPAIKLTVLARIGDEGKLARLIFQETTSIGIRMREEMRKKLHREIKEVNTQFGKVKFKIARLGDEIINATPEYEDCKRIAHENNLTLKKVYQLLGGVVVRL
ncbi:MAG: nickel pincer cofactor biosynthesis protein LarC [Calditrichaeota bacterium]|nr:MAG: nickel pincer cofactor biosynthesis protein LarC [Calditrichota bacterium]